MKRRDSRRIHIGRVAVGGGAPISVQTMTKGRTTEFKKILREIRGMERAGAEIIRVGIPDEDSLLAFRRIRERVKTPLVADIHFHHRLALGAIEAGADGIRINPGNMGKGHLRAIAAAARERKTAIRIGVNAGSLEKGLRAKYADDASAAMVESALRSIDLFYSLDFDLLKVSLKTASVIETVRAYRALSARTDLPFHLGVTEAGSILPGAVKNSMALGILLSEGIGDTIRVSLTAPATQEVRVGREILQSLGLRSFGPHLISCPTCARREIDVSSLERELGKRLLRRGQGDLSGLRIAIMGCEVNGPGEAGDADFGIFGSGGRAIVMAGGRVLARVPEDRAMDSLFSLIEERARGGED